MSEKMFNNILRSFEEWQPRELYEDIVCLYELSKVVHGVWELQERDVQTCEQLDCQTLKTYYPGQAEVSTFEQCDSAEAAVFDGSWDDMQVVRAVIGGDWTRRGGLTGRFVWNGAGAVAYCRFKGISRAGTHHFPLTAAGECEECDNDNHWEGWIRGAVVDGEFQGATLHAAYAFNLDPTNGTVAFTGTVEGVIVRQCD